MNIGPSTVTGLTVLFPESRVYFGDLPAGSSSAYGPVPSGVYRYAAYSYVLNGEVVTQPVIDWVGESPMDGRAFTYTVSVDPTRPRFGIVQLVNVTRDR